MNEVPPTISEIVAAWFRAAIVWWWLILVACSLARVLKGLRFLRLSVPIALFSIFILHSDVRTALDGLSAQPLRLPIIEPWFYAPALVLSILCLFTIMFVRAVILKCVVHWMVFAGLVLLWIAVLNLNHRAFIPHTLVSWILVTTIPLILGFATRDLWMSFKKEIRV